MENVKTELEKMLGRIEEAIAEEDARDLAYTWNYVKLVRARKVIKRALRKIGKAEKAAG